MNFSNSYFNQIMSIYLELLLLWELAHLVGKRLSGAIQLSGKWVSGAIQLSGKRVSGAIQRSVSIKSDATCQVYFCFKYIRQYFEDPTILTPRPTHNRVNNTRIEKNRFYMVKKTPKCGYRNFSVKPFKSYGKIKTIR